MSIIYRVFALVALTPFCLAMPPFAAEIHEESALSVRTGQGGSSLVLDGIPFHRTGSVISEQRLILVPGTGTRVALWTETDADGQAAPYYSIGRAGAPMGTAVETSYTLKVRHGEFDPVRRVPPVDPSLASGESENLYIVQFETQALQEYRDAISIMGGRVLAFMANHAHIVRMSPGVRDQVAALPFVRWTGPYHPAYRLEEYLLQNRVNADMLFPDQRYNILVFEDGEAGLDAVIGRLNGMGAAVRAVPSGKYLAQATLTADQLYRVSAWDEVQFIDRWSPMEKDMDIVRETGGADYLETVAGYTGAGVRAEIFDLGFSLNHPDFQSRPLIEHGGPVGLDYHGTATCGINFGDGTGDIRARGLLPDGQGIVADVYIIGLTGATRYNHTGELLQDPYYAVFQSASVGSGLTFDYTTISADHDALLFDWDILHCQSQSNDGTRHSRPESWAKNVLSCGAFYHYDTPTRTDDCWCESASIGPASDGRIKPDLSFFYDLVYTTRTYTDGYGEFGGTSASTPSICGYSGLFFEMWSDGIFGNEVDPAGTVFDNRPHMTTAKAFMINTADQYPFSGPDDDMTRVHQGWGVPDIRNMYDLRDSISFIDESKLLGNMESVEYKALVSAGAPAMRVTMTYADPAGNPASSQQRINDLTLKVTSPSGTVYWGNFGLLDGNWSTPGGSADTIDTVENVFIENPDEGLWTIEIIASEINEDGHVETPELDADFALVVSGAYMATCTSDGHIALDRAAYVCEDQARIRVVDCDLNTDDLTVETVAVTIDSDTEPAGETVLLTETGPATATFQEFIGLSGTDDVGLLHVLEGDTVTATYIDADDGAGGVNLTRTDTATVDCTSPVISMVQAIDLNVQSAVITFTTDEPADGAVRYGLSCADLDQSRKWSGLTTDHFIPINGLQVDTTYFYAVDAVDQAGNSGTDDNGGSCYSFTTMTFPDFFTEQFVSDNDTDFLRFFFKPNGLHDYYDGCVSGIDGFPVDPAGGTVLSLSDDSFATVNLTGGNTVSLYGVSYGTFYVGSNGYITFDSGDSFKLESLNGHFDQPRISALFDDLDPESAGTVSWEELPDRVVVTFEGVPEDGETNTNNFQIEMFFSGDIAISFLTVDAIDGLTGLSEGNELPSGYAETDLSAMAACVAETCWDGILNQNEVQIDCGGVCPPCSCGSDPDCDDGLFCDGIEYCLGNICRPGLDPCPYGLCNEDLDQCETCDNDGVCEPGEDCANCPNDCISGGDAVCGNAVCEVAGGENCLTCPDDCNGEQQGPPAGMYCCGDGATGTNPVDCTDSRCDDGGKTCSLEPLPVYCCGDDDCNAIETVENCPADCTLSVPGEAGVDPAMTVTGFDAATGVISISFGIPCDALDHTLEYGVLSRSDLAAYNWAGQVCGLGVSGSYDWSANGAPESMFFVVVANNGIEEGSYGTDNIGRERPEDTVGEVCPLPQNLQYACD